MYSILREAFVYKPEALLAERLSTLGKIILFILLISFSVLSNYLFVYLGFIVLFVLFAVTGLVKGFLKLLRLLMILVSIALFFQIVSFIIYGYEVSSVRVFEAFTNNLRLVILAGAASLFLSITSTRELRWFLNKLGFREIGNVMQLTIIILAYMLFLADNASFMLTLKYRSKELVRRFLKPMLFSAVVAARQVAEYTAFYGYPVTPLSINRRVNKIDLVVNTAIALLVFIGFFYNSW